MKSKKGFTLIELLAIIVILAIIAVITVPIILNIIENSRKGAATDSAYGYKDAVSKWYVEKLSLDHNFNLSSSYTVTNGNLGNEQIPFSGDKPTSGYLNYTNNVLTTGCLVFGDYAVTFTNGEVSSTVKGECAAQVQETVLYYTYDSSATADANGNKITEKAASADASWGYYIKETTSGSTVTNQLCIVDNNTPICLNANDADNSVTAVSSHNCQTGWTCSIVGNLSLLIGSNGNVSYGEFGESSSYGCKLNSNGTVICNEEI